MEILIHRSSTMATIVKPKERQFQVVPVPAIFTRGRWECRDFKESSNFAVLSSGGSNITSENVQILELNSQPYNSEIPSTIPLMRNDVRNFVTTSIVLPNILPNAEINTINDNLVNEPNSVSSSVFVSQITVTEGESSKEGNSTSTNSTNNPNSVAIDNKIEQAMDLVKTHLTFAVREEVEQLRTQISDLEFRVNNLESENQILRQFAPAEVVANLPLLLQNVQQQHKAQASTDTDASTSVPLSQPIQVLSHQQSHQHNQQVTAQSTVNLATTTSSFAFISSHQSTNTIVQQQQQQQQNNITTTTNPSIQQQQQIQSISPKTRSPTPTNGGVA